MSPSWENIKLKQAPGLLRGSERCYSCSVCHFFAILFRYLVLSRFNTAAKEGPCIELLGSLIKSTYKRLALFRQLMLVPSLVGIQS